MFIETVGHASIFLTDKDNKPILITDPWLVGSTYWRSWWLQNYPEEIKLQKIYKSDSIFITHEHPDHFHPPTLKKFSKYSNLIIPDLPNKELEDYLENNKFKYEVIKKNYWKVINPKNDISIFSIPLWNDDSILLINTPKVIIINLNDSKPPKLILKKLKKFLKNSKKKSILLSSYSPASIVNSFRYNDEVISIKSKNDYIIYLNNLCNILETDIFMPFASQAIFYRNDSKWANDFKVTYEDLLNGWDTNKTKLIPCYSKISLDNLNYTFLQKDKFVTKNEYLINKKIEEQISKESNYEFDHNDRNLLLKKIKKISFFTTLFFRKGIGFKIDNNEYLYLNGKILDISNENKLLKKNNDFLIEVPGLVLKDVLNTNHFGDLGITMFTFIHSRKGLDPRLVYLFFILISLDDYGHIKSFSNGIKWLIKQIYNYSKFYFKPLKLP